MGLLKTGLKAVVAVKTADVIHERVLERQHAHATAHGHAEPAAAHAGRSEAMSAPPDAGSPLMGEKLAQLKQLGDLRASGVLTDTEFEVQKANILAA